MPQRLRRIFALRFFQVWLCLLLLVSLFEPCIYCTLCSSSLVTVFLNEADLPWTCLAEKGTGGLLVLWTKALVCPCHCAVDHLSTSKYFRPFFKTSHVPTSCYRVYGKYPLSKLSYSYCSTIHTCCYSKWRHSKYQSVWLSQHWYSANLDQCMFARLERSRSIKICWIRRQPTARSIAAV